jgi:uncharacterized protein (UPF0335 family)
MAAGMHEFLVRIDLTALVQRIEALEKEVEYLKRGSAEWIRSHEAERRGFSNNNLWKMRKDGRLVLGEDWKREGKTLYYNATSLQRFTDRQRVKKRVFLPHKLT